MRSPRPLLPLVGLAVLTSACGADPGAPVARIDLRPGVICEGDESALVQVSGNHSTTSEGEPAELRWAWSFSSAPLAVVRGSLTEPELTVRFAARAPVEVQLSLTDALERTSSRSRVLTLTRTQARSCEGGCAAGELCVRVSGAALCVPEATCTSDDDCGCLACRRDDEGAGRCLPR